MNTSSQNNPKMGNGFTQSRVFYGDCIVRTETESLENSLSAIVTAIAPKIISTGLDRFGKALRKSGEADTQTIVAQLNFDSSPGKVLKCIQIVRGNMALTASQARKESIKVSGVDNDLIHNILLKNKIYLAEKPNLFMEIRMRQSTDKSALSFAPAYYEYNALLNDNSENKSGRKSRGMALQLSFHPLGVAADSKKAFGAPLILGDIHIGSKQLFLSPKMKNIMDWQPAIETQWFPHYGAQSIASKVAATKPVNVPKSSSTPMTLTAIVSETRKANTFLLAVADIFDSAKPTLQTEIEKLLLKSKQEEADLNALKSQTENLTAYYTSLVDAESKVLDYCENAQSGDTLVAKKDRLNKSQQARVAQLNSNIAAMVAGQTAPFTQQIVISTGNVPEICP